MICPRCYYQVRTRNLAQVAGLSSVACNNCDIKIRPVYWRSFTLLGLALALAWGMEFLLESIDYSRFVGIAGSLLTFLLAYVAFAGPLLRLQEKEEEEMSVPHRHKG